METPAPGFAGGGRVVMLGCMTRPQGPLAFLPLLALLGAGAASAAPPAASPPGGEGFEDAAPGPLLRLESPVGLWLAAPGAAAVQTQHVRSGRRSLHLTGGDRCEVVLELAPGEGARRLSFWAERWTRADPFALVVEARVEGGWREVSDASAEVVIGGFLTEVVAVLPEGTGAARIRCVSPPGKGVLIDDVSLHAARPMSVVACRASQPVLPVLVGNRTNPVLAVEIETEGLLSPLSLESVTFDLHGSTHAADLSTVEVLQGGSEAALPYDSPDTVLGPEARLGDPVDVDGASSAPITVSGARELRPGRNVFWVSVTPEPDADLDARVDARLHGVRVGGQDLEVSGGDPEGTLRMGVALRTAGSDGSRAYRIPGLATTPAGTLIAVYDIRWRGWGDLPGRIDVGMSRSTDGGRTWSPMEVILSMGEGDGWSGDGAGDPAVLVDRATGNVHVLAVWSHGNRAWRGSGPGLGPEETGQLMLVTSEDDGRTFGPARNLTAMVKDPDWAYLLQGPGRGITTSDGRLVFPAQFQLGPSEGRTPHSTVLVSEDGGRTWRIGTGARADTTESAVVELEDGELMVNMRDNRGGSRAVMITRDAGATWSTHPSSRGALSEPVCMASLIHVGREVAGVPDGRLLFSNPAVAAPPRRRMTIRASADGGRTWPEARWLLLDEGRSAGYSCLTMVDAETVGILYEGSRAHLTFQRVPLSELFPPPPEAAPGVPR